MKTAVYALAFAATLSRANAYWKGFNVQATLADGTCKSQSDWEANFTTMKPFPGAFTSMRVYASSDCDTLVNAVPAAIATGGQILVGVWTEDDTHYEAEKQALLTAVETYGFDWMVAVSVGSEDLYRGDTTASTLAQQIYDVRGWARRYMDRVGGGANSAVIEAGDFVGTDGYPYWQSTEANGIDEAYNLFFESVQEVKDAVSSAKSGVDAWVTETGWPTTGASENEAVANVANAQQYWDTVACAVFEQIDTFWYALQDFSASPSFGIVDASFNALYDLSCPDNCEA